MLLLTNGSCKVLLDLVGGQGPFPDDEFIKCPVHITLGLIPLGASQEICAGVSVIVENFPVWISGVQSSIDIDLQSLSRLPSKENMSPIGTCKALKVTAKSMNQFHSEPFSCWMWFC